MRAPLRSSLSVSILFLSVACDRGGGGGDPPILQAQSLADTSWTLQSVEGSTGSVQGSWQFRANGTYTFAFEASIAQVQGDGTYTFDGTFLRITGPVQQLLGTGTLAVWPLSAGQLAFADDDDDLWIWNGRFGATAQASGTCIPVQQGPWEFGIEFSGLPVLQFVDGDLRQSGCVLSYDDDAIFRGLLNGSQWTVNAARAGLRFVGTFAGSPATQFTGMWTDADGNSDRIVGAFVGN